MSVFIEVQIDSDHVPCEIEQLCPVNIFSVQDGHVTVIRDNEDECTLCELCLDAAPPNAIRIRKLYKDETLVSRGASHAAAAPPHKE